ncbi:hypothetical protein PP175_29030 (plasmid) [Aneurinibacillus sp. Ricciae_BoGa-3]|uniref:hypothetical protein n=1 Tax=Aneurinibacillus sp. Ricciae_BoGa-3 TaxID=3022697 RepID=UPI0023416D68|nr:hypothetical protein [Aneurinibacillus sp. Ricciae_BoGa-3]WCK57236.1 hypothetical protein PP175_29030 [Aneurinibacillus sp. Ricciae_BoGa-3]
MKQRIKEVLSGYKVNHLSEKETVERLGKIFEEYAKNLGEGEIGFADRKHS